MMNGTLLGVLFPPRALKEPGQEAGFFSCHVEVEALSNSN